MASFKERMFEKMEALGLTSSQFLDNLTELFCDIDGLTNEELREDLKANGTDVDAQLERVKALLKEHGINVNKGGDKEDAKKTMECTEVQKASDKDNAGTQYRAIPEEV